MTGWTTSVTSLHTSSRDTDTPFFALDRDSAQWKLGDKQVQRRRNLFWELFTLETIHVSWISTEEACSHSNTSQSMSLAVHRPSHSVTLTANCQRTRKPGPMRTEPTCAGVRTGSSVLRRKTVTDKVLCDVQIGLSSTPSHAISIVS